MNAVKWAIVCLAFTASLFSQAPTNGLSVYLPLNGTSTDLSGTGKQITAQGMTFASGPNSTINQSAYFDGASSKIDFAPALSGTAEITVSFWAKNQAQTGIGSIFVDFDDAAGNDVQIRAQDEALFVQSTKNGGNLIWTSPTKVLAVSEGWKHIIWVMGATQSSIFVNGSLYATIPARASNVGYKRYSNIGYTHTLNPYDFFKGYLASFRIYERALSSIEASQLYQAESSPTTSPPNSTPDLTTGLIGRYPLDGDGRDLSPSANTLVTYSVQATSDRNGNPSGAVYLDGSTSWMVSTNNVPISGSNPRTMSVWIKSDELSFYKGNPVILGLGSKSGTNTLYDLCLSGRSAQSWANGASVFTHTSWGGFSGSTDSRVITSSQWFHLAITSDGTRNGSALYTNGVKQPIIGDAGTWATVLGKLRVSTGSQNSGPVNESFYWWNQGFKGSMDDIRIYSRQLSDSEIAALYQQYSTANSAPTISTQPSGQSLLVGQSFQLNVITSGSSPLSYQWLKSGAVIAGATASSYTVASASTADTGAYTVTISNSFGSATSSPAAVTVTTPPPQAPVFTQQPASIAKTVGSSHSFSVSVTGYPAPALQWLKNGVRLSGQNSITLTFASITVGEAATYTCEATNASGAIGSQPAVLSVGLAPSVIRSLPVTTVEAKIGDPLRIDLPPLAGTTPLSYRWSRDSSVIAGSGDVLQIGALTSAGAGLYSCTVSNAYGSVQIDRVRVTLIEAPRITSQPASASITATSNATFSVTASGTPTPTYQWYRNEVLLSGQTAAQITVSGSSAALKAGGYYCVVTNRAGSVSSATALLTISGNAAATPSITRTVQQQEIGRSLYFEPSDTVFVPGLGQVTSRYSTFSSNGSGTNRTTNGTSYFNGEVRPRAGSVKDYEGNFERSTPVALVDYGNFAVTFPTGDADGNGINDAFDYLQAGNVTALGSGYDYYNGGPFSAEGRFTRAAGEVKGRYALKTIAANGNTAEASGDFYVGGINGIRIGSSTYVRGASSVMNVSLAPDAALGPDNHGGTYSGSFPFTVTDRDTIAYSAFEFANPNNVRYSVRAGTLRRAGRVYSGSLVYADGRTGTTFVDYVSHYFTITDLNDADSDGIPDLSDDLPTPPALSSFSGTARTLEPGARLEFTARAQDTAIFVWKKDGVVLRTSANSPSDTFVIPAVARSDTGAYWVELTNGAGTASSAIIPVVVSSNNVLPAITVQPMAAQLSAGGNLILSVAATAGNSARYQWRKDGVDIPGATGSVFGKVSQNTTEAGHYSVLVTNEAGATLSQLASVSYLSSSDTAPRISGLSVRTRLQPNQPLIVGTVVSGSGKPLLMRAIGPTLDVFGLQGAPETTLEIYNSTQKITAQQGWEPALATIFPLLGSFPLTANSKDSAILRSMAGAFTLHTIAPASGAALVEVYDAAGGAGQRLIAMSVRNKVGTDSDILIAGLAVGGVGRINLLLRAVGPMLAVFGVEGTLQDPKITVYKGDAVLATNDNWSADLAPVFTRVGAFGLAADSRDAALLFSADAGSVYTIHVAGVNNTTGEALVEVYEVP